MKIELFFGNINKFAGGLIKHWTLSGHEVRWAPNYSIWKGYKPDLMFFDTVTSNLIGYTNRFPVVPDCKVVARMHGVGCRLNLYRSVDWSKVDDLIYVSDWLQEQCPNIPTEQHVVYNGVNLDKFTLKKSFEPTYKIAYVGYSGHLKGLDEVPKIRQKFKEIDSRYEIFYALGDVNNMNEWLEDKDYLVMPSSYETFCYAVAEALAKGIKPLIAKWPGAERIWGDEFWLDDFNLEREEPEYYRHIIESRYNEKRMIEEISEICGVPIHGF